ncbi:MAG TPA: type II secretion system protein GspG [Myxococcaceae bacterium]|nr:type II secretion system protein GspG [Myxococcaceae bacterium]
MDAPEERLAAARRRRRRALLFAGVVVLAGVGSCWVVYRALEQPPQYLEPARLRTLLNAAKLYRKDTGRFPSTADGLVVLAPKYIAAVGEDGWGRPYHYESDGGSVRIWTLGRDGLPGGEGADADLVAQFPPGFPDAGMSR